jgi:hypothetical protein
MSASVENRIGSALKVDSRVMTPANFSVNGDSASRLMKNASRTPTDRETKPHRKLLKRNRNSDPNWNDFETVRLHGA